MSRPGKAMNGSRRGWKARRAAGRRVACKNCFRYGRPRDITRRKQSEQTLKKLNRTLRAISHSSLALMRSEAQGEAAYLTEVCRIITQECGHAMVWIGFRRNDPGKTIQPAYCAGFEEGYLDTLRLTWADEPRGRGATGTAIRTGVPCRCRDTWTDPAFEPWRAEALKRGYRSSLALPLAARGSIFGALTMYSLEVDAFSDDEVALLQELATDLALGITAIHHRTEQAMAEQALRASEDRYRGLADSIPAMLWAADTQGVTTDHNLRWIEYTGLTRAQGQGEGWQAIIHPEDLARVVERWSHCTRTGENYEIEYRIRRAADGAYRWHSVQAILAKDHDGRPLGWFGTLLDIEDRKLAEKVLQEESQRKDDFLALLGHELRNPLAPIRTAVHLMTLPGQSPEKMGAYGAILERQVSHLTRLVGDLLDVSRIARGQVSLEMEDFDLVATLRGVLEDYRPLVAERGLLLGATLGAEGIWIRGDRIRIVQAVNNLLHNAIKFTGSGGRIHLAAGLQGEGRAYVRVEDTGVGIPREELPMLFEPFRKNREAIGRSRGGLGLGLSLARGLAELHGGTLVAESEGPGCGARFTLELPMLPVSPVPRAAVAPEAPTGSGAVRPRRILIVEDLLDAATTLQMVLEMEGHAVEMAHDGKTGLERAQEFAPDIVLCDIGLPGSLDGYGVARALRNSPRGKALYLIAMTGFGTREDRDRALRAGFDAHLTKPVAPETLVPMIAGIRPS